MPFDKDRPIDLLKAITMVLIHDLVEIDAGDTPIHAAMPRDDKFATEQAAAKRIFGLLPEHQQRDFIALWEEFECGHSAEATFARAVDRLQPLILNLVNRGGTWTENQVTERMVGERYGVRISAAFPDLWPEIRQLVHQHFSNR